MQGTPILQEQAGSTALLQGRIHLHQIPDHSRDLQADSLHHPVHSLHPPIQVVEVAAEAMAAAVAEVTVVAVAEGNAGNH